MSGLFIVATDNITPLPVIKAKSSEEIMRLMAYVTNFCRRNKVDHVSISFLQTPENGEPIYTRLDEVDFLESNDGE
jgi:hypothetical protein